MGFLTDFINQQDSRRGESEAQIKERLSLLKQTAEFKINNLKKQMETEFYENQQSRASFSIIGRPIEFLAQYRVNIREGINDEIEHAISDLFKFNKQSLVQALKIMVVGALKEAFITTKIGEENYEKYYIVPYNNTIVRLDFRGWKYSFSNIGVIGTVENAFCYIVSKSIINFNLLTEEEIIYFLTEALGGAPMDVVKNYIQDVVDIYNFVSKLHNSNAGIHAKINPNLMSENNEQFIQKIRTEDVTNWEVL